MYLQKNNVIIFKYSKFVKKVENRLILPTKYKRTFKIPCFEISALIIYGLLYYRSYSQYFDTMKDISIDLIFSQEEWDKSLSY